MSMINCYYIIDKISCLCEQVIVSDTLGLNVKYFQISAGLPQYKFVADSQYFEKAFLSVNNFDWNEWLREESGHLKYVQLISSTQIKMVVSNNA